MRLLIAIPVHNEKKYFNGVLDKVIRFHKDVLVVDDGSTDGTSQLLADRVAARGDVQMLRHPVNLGYGQSIIDSFRYADAHGYDWVVTMDCDEQHEAEMLPEFFRFVQADRWDVISGSRYMQPRKEDDLPPNDRRMINLTLTAALNDLFGWQLTDSFCGFKAHRVSAMRKLQLDERGYAFPLQLWPQCAAHGIRIKEIPVRLIYNDPNRSFGAILDDATIRLKHYLEVLAGELQKTGRDAESLHAVATVAGLPRIDGERLLSSPTAIRAGGTASELTVAEPSNTASCRCCCPE